MSETKDVLDTLLEAEGLDAAAIERVHDGLKAAHRAENQYLARERARDQQATARKAARAAAFASAVPYRGAITRCQASKSPARGAPYRCGNKATYVRATTRDRWSKPKLIVTCTRCAHDPLASPYNGWGGDPHPNIGTIEPEYNYLLETSDA